MPCLAISALWYVVLDPGCLQRMQRTVRLRKTFDGRDLDAG